MKFLHTLSYILILIGALNWGLIGFFGFDLVAAIFGPMTALTRLTYALVGLAAVTNLILEYTVCKAYSHCYTTQKV